MILIQTIQHLQGFQESLPSCQSCTNKCTKSWGDHCLSYYQDRAESRRRLHEIMSCPLEVLGSCHASHGLPSASVQRKAGLSRCQSLIGLCFSIRAIGPLQTLHTSRVEVSLRRSTCRALGLGSSSGNRSTWQTEH